MMYKLCSVQKQALLIFMAFFFFFQAYLESFYTFCKNIGGVTKDIMCPVLEVL